MVRQQLGEVIQALEPIIGYATAFQAAATLNEVLDERGGVQLETYA